MTRAVVRVSTKRGPSGRAADEADEALEDVGGFAEGGAQGMVEAVDSGFGGFLLEHSFCFQGQDGIQSCA
jgi:hypothetical protein